MRLQRARVRVLPLEGENRDDDDKDKRARGRRAAGAAARRCVSARCRHRPLTLPAGSPACQVRALATSRPMPHTGGRPSRARRGRRATRPVGLDVLRAFGVLWGNRVKPENKLTRRPSLSLELDVAHTERHEVDFRVRRAHHRALVGTPSAKPTSHTRRNLHRPRRCDNPVLTDRTRTYSDRSGLYDPAYEHDACGVAFVARLDGRPSHETVRRALDGALEPRAPRRLRGRRGHRRRCRNPHANPDTFFRASVEGLPSPGRYGVGAFFLPHDDVAPGRARGARRADRGDEGQRFLGWRDVPVDLLSGRDRLRRGRARHPPGA